MPRYNVTQNYKSRRDGLDYGPWEAGGQIDLSEADADWVNRDSPGTLTPVEGKPAERKAAETTEAAPKRQQRAGRDRQQKTDTDRSAT